MLNIQTFKKNPRIIVLFSVILFCGACASAGDKRFPEFSAESFSKSGTAYLPDFWWVSLNDQSLNNHVRAALENNFSLAAAWERLQAARSLAQRQASNLYPDLDIEGDAARRIDDTEESDNFSAGPAASYEVDLWGEVRAAAAAEDLRAKASEEAYRTAALSLSADIAITWVRLTEANNQIRLLNSQIATNEKALEVLKARFGAGQVRSEDILRQQLLIESVREEKISVESDKGVLEHLLAVLRGETPQAASFATKPALPKLADLPDTGLSSELINRRPDIRRAELEIAAADKDLAAAIRDQYPSLTLSASYISEAATAGNLFSDWITTLAAGLLAPVFDGGERKAEAARREALRNALINDYGQTVLDAFREVEDALIREQKQRERIQNLQVRLSLARDSYEQIQLGYFNGANEFISVLDAQDELQGIERDYLRARRNLIEFRIALYRALAGGFETPFEKTSGKG